MLENDFVLKNGTRMDRERTLLRYKAVDITIWIVMLAVFETLIARAGSSWFKEQPYILSLVPALTLIMYMRWSLFGVPYASLGGLILSLALSASGKTMLVYILGNLLSVVIYPVMKKIGKERIANSAFLSALMALFMALLMQTGRAVFSLVMGSGSGSFLSFYTTDALSGVFSLIIILIVRKRDGVFEDQISYLKRLNSEEEEKRNEGERF